jgi:hypothetical protein
MKGMSPQTAGPLSSFYSTGPVLSLKPLVQAKLAIGQPNDIYEKEADRSVTPRGWGHDFSRVPVPPAGATERFAAYKGATATVNVDGGVSDEEVVTSNHTPAPAPPVTPPTPPPPPSGQCYVKTAPTYTPKGTIPVKTTGGRKSAMFSMAATFGTSFVTKPPRNPACCEVRQYIKWDNAFHTWKGGPPHSGFPSSATANNWYEDRNSTDTFRYGYRSGYGNPVAGCGSEYRTGNTQDQANGDTYCGRDTPGGPAAMTGQFQFQLKVKVQDTCNSNAKKASSSIIKINW